MIKSICVYLLLAVLAINTAVGQSEIKYVPYHNMGTVDFSPIWTSQTVTHPKGEKLVLLSEPIGFLGDNYQRVQIHFTSVIRHPQNGEEYYAYGKTKIKETVLEFQGKIVVESASLIESNISEYQQGIVKGQFELFELKGHPEAGYLRGEFESKFIVIYNDRGDKIIYDVFNIESASYKNNQFKGTKTFFEMGDSRIMNWGDYRIPESGQLDIGKQRFEPSPNFSEFGWKDYQPGITSTTEKNKWWLKK